MAEKQQKITVSAFLHQNNTFFIAKRAETKKFLPGKFELPGGHVEYGETLEEALKREFQEEFDLEIAVGQPFYAFTYINHNNDHVVEIDYLARLVDPASEIVLKPEEHSEYRWVAEIELDTIWDPNDAEYAAIKRGFELTKQL